MSTIRDVYLDRQSGRLYDSFRSQSELTLWDFVQGDTGLIWNVHNMVPAPGASINSDEPFAYSDTVTDTIQVAVGNLNELSTGGTGAVIDTETEATSGLLVVGARYFISDYNAGDDFANVGGTNVTGNIFTASGDTPTDWTNGSTLYEIADGIAYNATAAAFQSAINTKLLTNYSTATVTIGTDANPWTIDRVAVGDIAPLLGYSTGLIPDSIAKVEQLTDSATGSMRQRVRFIQRPAIYSTSSTYFAVATGAVAIKRTGTATANCIQRITFSPTTYGGVYELTCVDLGVGNATTIATPPIPFGASQDDIQTIINDAFGTGNEVTVSVVNDYTIDITFTGTNVDLVAITQMGIEDSGLLAMMGWVVEINSNTSGASDLLGTEDSVSTNFEIQITDGDGLVTTPYYNTVTLRAELISAETSGATEFPGFATAAQFALITHRAPLTITAAVTSEVAIPKYTKFMTVDATIDTGSYTHNIDLASVSLDRVSGDKCEVILRMDAGFDSVGLINIRNDTGSTVLWPENGVSASFTRVLFFTWTGSAWTSDQ